MVPDPQDSKEEGQEEDSKLPPTTFPLQTCDTWIKMMEDGTPVILPANTSDQFENDFKLWSTDPNTRRTTKEPKEQQFLSFRNILQELKVTPATLFDICAEVDYEEALYKLSEVFIDQAARKLKRDLPFPPPHPPRLTIPYVQWRDPPETVAAICKGYEGVWFARDERVLDKELLFQFFQYEGYLCKRSTAEVMQRWRLFGNVEHLIERQRDILINTGFLPGDTKLSTQLPGDEMLPDDSNPKEDSGHKQPFKTPDTIAIEESDNDDDSDLSALDNQDSKQPPRTPDTIDLQDSGNDDDEESSDSSDLSNPNGNNDEDVESMELSDQSNPNESESPAPASQGRAMNG